jgi:AraC family transcriptional regulator
MENPIAIYKQLIEFIEQHLHTPITLEDLEQESGLSRFQLTRLFVKLCGYSPIDYVRRRKLSKSIPDLYNKRKIIDIALDYGFEYEQSYIRAFRSVYHFSPTQLRKTQQPVKLFEPPTLSDIQIYSDGFLVNPEIKYLPNTNFIGEEKYYNYKDNNVYGLPLLDGLEKYKAGLFTGICLPCESGSFTHRYIRCCTNPAENTVVYTLPKGKYACFNYTGFHPLDKLGAHKIRTLMYIVIGSWANQNNVLWREQFIESINFDDLQQDYIEIDILLPISTSN